MAVCFPEAKVVILLYKKKKCFLKHLKKILRLQLKAVHLTGGKLQPTVVHKGITA